MMQSMETYFSLTLCDLDPDLVYAWRRAFAAFPEIEVQRGDLLEIEAEQVSHEL